MAVLINLTSALAIAAARRRRSTLGVRSRMLLKTLDQQWSGVFLWLLISCFISAEAYAEGRDCPALGKLQWASLKSIVDGDTLSLSDGRKLRVIAINTPELARGARLAQPLAAAARAAVKDFFAGDTRVGLQLGVDDRDHYGRLLSHVFRAGGTSLSAYLLARGLAWQVVVPPNVRYWSCLAGVEQRAREQAVGIWAEGVYPIKSASTLRVADSGFQHVEGRVTSVVRSRRGWWLQLGPLAVRLQDKDMHYFTAVDPMQWQNKTLQLRGWLIDRSDSKAVREKGYSALMLDLRHPAMLK